MSQVVNPILAVTALLAPLMPDIYQRNMIYDPTWDDPSYNDYVGKRIVPAVGSLVRDPDETGLWVTGIDPVTFIPSYTAIAITSDNDSITSLLNYGNTVMRVYGDYRSLPYPVTPDNKAIFIGKSPRFYTLTRYPNTADETIISQYFDTTGKFTSSLIPMRALDTTNSSWYLPRSHVSVILEDNEEIAVRIFGEDGAEVYSALMFAKQSSVINEDVIYTPTIVGMTVSGNQRLTNGTFYVYEKQDFGSLGLTATIVYDNGMTDEVSVDGVKCILYGEDDFISSFSGLQQNVTVKYYRSRNESIAPGIGDATGEMISKTVPVTVIPNTFGTTAKIMAIPIYNTAQGRYIVKYWMYFGDGRSHLDISAYATISSGALVTDPSFFGIVQTYVISVDMSKVDPVHYTSNATFQQNIVIQLNAPNVLVKYTIRDSKSSPFVFGADSVASRRPSINYDSARKQYFIPSAVFANLQAFLKSFYTQAAPPYDPSLTLLPPQPTHFVVRDIVSGVMLTPGMIPVSEYSKAFTITDDTVGHYVGLSVMVEFVNVVNSAQSNILFGVPVNVSTGSYLGA
jgi:hypothetical protein